MPVSLERLIVEAESAVVTDELIRDSIVVSGGADAELAAEKKQGLPFAQVEALALSFRNLACISNLGGLERLTKLQLDNNHIGRIENLGHLTCLTWLDLSFNTIKAIEGLERLTRLQDLSLFNNQISSLAGLDGLASLNVLSLGNNALLRLDGLSCLLGFSQLSLLTLSGNPLAREPAYRTWVLSHLKQLRYLDYRCVLPADRVLAMEAHQDEMAELHEAEEAAAAAAAAAAERSAHAAAMAEANLTGVETLLDDMVTTDAEWAKLAAIPGLLEPWNDVRDKWQVATDEFKLVVLDALARKKAEAGAYKAALAAALGERDGQARALVAAYERSRKEALRLCGSGLGGASSASSGSGGGVVSEEQLLAAKVRLMALQEALLALEGDTVEAVGQLVGEYERAAGEAAEAAKFSYNAYFAQVRELQAGFASALASAAPALLDRYSGAAPGGGVSAGAGAAMDSPELEGLPEAVLLLLGDKDALLNALQSSHDAHVGVLDGLEDTLVGRELAAASAIADTDNAWQEQRHRDSMCEALAYLERSMQELDALAESAAETGGATVE